MKALLFALALAGCACNPASGKVEGATCARQVVIGIDAVHGAGAKLARRWIASCRDEARALKAAGKLAEADKRYGECTRVSDPAAKASVGLDDSTEVLASGIDAGEKIGQKDYSGAVQPALKMARDFVKLLANQGVEIPKYLTAFLGVQ